MYVSIADAERAQALLRSSEDHQLDDDEERERQQRLETVPNDTIAAGLKKIRGRRRRTWLLMAASLPAYGAVLFMFGDSVLVGLFAACYMLTLMISMCLAAWSPCPKMRRAL